ncbi:FG-GAP-like repeat-containing protein [Stieleria varia]|uniref:tRNA3(Ser)-specific nuclease WapA n=1 Tax=Stieleria varia TaxID=2528005 RepID=A0A5C6B113_9BACT|nr:FG-GAP-like repeat-containing protein [Stieleria varia]TWU04986.1 tRNA3(Ser)-specific nuclease WapA precursor [Stieleria varia]
MLAAAVWHNSLYPADVNGNTVASALDALTIINELGQNRYSDPLTRQLNSEVGDNETPPLFDVNCSGSATALDALLVINVLGGKNPDPVFKFAATGDGILGDHTTVGCDALLSEGESLRTEIETRVTLGADTDGLRLRFDAPQFDTSSIGAMQDAFEVTVTDVDGNLVSQPYSAGRTAQFNWSESAAGAGGAATTFTPDTETSESTHEVLFNLSHLEKGTQVILTARLINNDGDDGTTVLIRDLERVAGLEQPPLVFEGESLLTRSDSPLRFDQLEDVSSSIGASYGRTSYTADRSQVITELVVTNLGNQAVTGQLVIVIDRISELDAVAMRPDGILPDGRPFFDMTGYLDGPLLPGDSTRPREIRFTNPGGNRFQYRLTTMGDLNVAPNAFESTPIDKIEATRSFRYVAQATDPDQQQLTYSIEAGPESMSVDPTSGEVVWPTVLADVGNHTVTIRATDPYGLFIDQKFSLAVVETLQNRPPNFVSEPVTDAIASSGFEITTVAIGDSPAGVNVISGFQGPRLVSINTGNQTVGVYAGKNNDRFDDAETYATGFPTADGQLFDVGYAVDIGLPEFRANDETNGIFGLDQGDLNGDGILDLVALYTYDAPSVGQNDQLVITGMLGEGNGDFGSPIEILRQNIGSGSNDIRNLLLRDVNGDGSLDVLAVERQRNPRLITILGHGDGTFDAAVEQTFSKTLSDFRTADIDEDGNLDLIGRTASLGFGASYEAVWLKGNGDGTFTEPIVIGSAGGDPNCCYATQQRPHDVLDLNGDGNLDIAFLTGNGVTIYHSDGNGNFTQPSGVTPTTALARDWIRGGDFNGDGIADLVFHHGERLEVLLGNGDGVTFTSLRGPETDGLLSNYAGTDDPVDVDGDGDLDLIFGHSSGDWTSTKVAINDGAGNFSITEYAMVDFSGDIQPFEAGDIARGAMFGDYNWDGVIDFSYFTSGADFNGVGIRLGTRPGEFGQTRTIPWVPGSRDEDALPGDFNGDGIVDLVDTVNDRVFLGVGDGSFAEPFPAVGVSRPGGFGSTADFNLDGLDDIVATRANQNGSRYYVALANGDGTFTVSDDQLVQSSFYGYSSTLIADFNQDGLPDFVAKSSVEQQIDVHINSPSDPGVFTRTFRITLPRGSNGTNISSWEESYAVADFTGDGIPDLAFAERNSDTDGLIKLIIMEGDGQGDFSRQGEQTIFDNGSQPGDFSAGDINSDGSVDLVAATTAGARVLINDGTGSFEFLSLFEYPGTEQRGRDSWLVDFDEDGQLDLIQTGANGNGPLIVRLGNGDGTFDAPQQLGLVGGIPGRISRNPFADLDGDGHLDFVYATGSVGNYSSDTASIFAGRRDDLVDLLAVDLNGDGNEEILAIQQQMERLQIFVGDNLGGFTRQPDLLTGRAPHAVAAVDLDSDGRLELLTANRTSRSLSVFTGSIDSGYTSAEFPVGLRPIDVAAADVDGDGNQDILVLDDAENALWLFLGDGTTTLGTPTPFALGDKPSRFSIADATGDGILDAVMTLPDTQRLMILPGDGMGAFGAPIYVDLAEAPSDVAVVDLNDDGNPDLAATLTNLNVLSVLYGRGNDQFSRAQHIQVGESPSRVTLADADEDGRMDFVVANSGDATASVIYNRFDPNEVYRYDADAIDPDDDHLTYAIVDGPGGMIINSETGALLWAAAPDQVGVHDVTISADDGRGGIATQSFKIDVVAARENAAPLIATQSQATIGAGETFTYQATALDNDRDALRYRLIDAPPGATIDPTTGLVEWDGRGTALIFSPYGDPGEVRVAASDSLKPASTTIEGWFNIHKLTASNGASLFFSLPGAHGQAYYLRSLFNDRFQLIMDFDGAKIDFQPRYQFQVDKWIHIALTVDDASKTATIWVDGKVIGSTTIPDSIGYSNSGTLNVGEAGSWKTQATIENFRIWNVAFTGTEIDELMTTQYENDARLALDFRFEDTRMLSVQDHSVYGNTGFRISNGLLPQSVTGLTDAGSHTFTVSVEDGRGGYDEQTFTVNVAPELRGSIAGHLFDDLDGDGVQDDGSENPAEPSLQGWQLYIDTNGNAYPDPGEPQAITDASGDYQFDGLLPGEYPVRISPVAGYDVPTVETNVDVEVNEETAFDLAIEQLSLSHVRGQLRTEDGDAIAYWKVYADLDGNGGRDTDEPMATSDRNGNFSLTGLVAGDYTIRLDLPAGWADVAGRDGLDVTVAVDEVLTGQDFTLTPTNTSVTGGVHFVTMPPAEVEARQVYRYASVAFGILNPAIVYDLSLAPDGMSVDPTSGLLAWRPTINQVGQHTVILRATADDGSISLHDFNIDVTAPNFAPAITRLPAPLGFVGIKHVYDVVAQDAEQETVTYALVGENHSASIDPDSGRFTWTPTVAGDYEFTIRASDMSGASTEEVFIVSVSAATPTVALGDLTGPRTSFPLTQKTVTRIAAVDSIGRPVDWSITSGPAGLSIGSDGVMTWTPAVSQFGQHPVSLAATDADGQVFVVPLLLDVVGSLVNATPVVNSTPTTSAVVGREYQYDILASDVDGDPLSFDLLDAPAGMSIDAGRGTIRWTPAADQLGESDVVVRVADTFGAETTQSFKLRVSRTGGPPIIASFPESEASVGVAYFYSVKAKDAESDPLVYRLLTAPSGMTIAELTGEITWTPTIDQLGQQSVVIEVSDGIGGAATQTFAILVSDGVPNAPPTIDNVSPRFAAVSDVYSHVVSAADPEGTTLTYSLSESPTGMTISPTSGQINWTPVAGQDGKHVVTIRVTDVGGAAAIESFELDVLAQNTEPVINGIAPVDVAAGAEFRYDVLASDADLDRLTFDLLTSPAGATIDTFGRIRWQTSVAQIGDHDFEVRVNDPRGGEVTQSFTLAVIEDLVPPKVSLIENLGDGSRNILPWQGPFRVFVKAIDNVAVASLTLTANGKDIPLDAAGTATFTFEEWTFSTINATATAIDTNGNATTKTIQFDYDFPEGWSGAGTTDIPTAAITSPADTGTVTGMVSIVGTAAHEDLFGYKLSYRHIDETRFTEFHESTTAVTNGELGVWDTSLLLNDEYVIRLEVATNAGVVNVAEHHVGLAGELKLGNFRLSFTDMVIPVAGIPIEITRIYDTLQADREGDFGYGWRLEYRNTDLRVGLPKSGLEDIGIYTPMRPGVKVYLNVPGQGRQGFTFNPDIRVLPGFGGQNLTLARPRFTPDPGVTSTLSTGTSGYLQVNELGELYAPGGIPYNPASPAFGGAYVLTTRDGIVYRVNGSNGTLSSAADRNRNTLKFSSSGITTSSGLSVNIGRDALGRINRITDLNGESTFYTYDPSGDLTAVQDREGNLTLFEYSTGREHYLTRVEDPLGRTTGRTEYDENGRLSTLVDIGGNAVQVSIDPTAQSETIIDAHGNETLVVYDSYGNVVQSTDTLGNTRWYEYDSNRNRIASVDPLGNRYTRTFNANGFVTSRIDPLGNRENLVRDSFGVLLSYSNALGNTTRFENDQAGNITVETLADGSQSRFEYDSAGNLLKSFDANGAVTTNQFDAAGRILSVVSPEGTRQAYEYNANGNLVAVISFVSINGVLEARRETRTFDAEGRGTGLTNVAGDRVRVFFDAAGQPTRSEGPLGRSSETTYSESGQPTNLRSGNVDLLQASRDPAESTESMTMANGVQMVITRDSLGQIVSKSVMDEQGNVAGSPETLSYDKNGRIIGVSDANGSLSNFEYDAAGRRTGVTAGAEKQTLQYDAVGRVTSETANGKSGSVVYDEVGQLIRTELSNGSDIEFEYDQVGNLIAEYQDGILLSRYSYDLDGNLTQVIDADGHATTYERDEFGRVVSFTDSLGRETTYGYDKLGNRTRLERPDGSILEYKFNARGELTEIVQPSGISTKIVYDEFGRVTQRTGGNLPVVDFVYDEKGYLASVGDSSQQSTFAYDSFGRVDTQTLPSGRTAQYTYTTNGQVASIETPGGTRRYTYTPTGLVATVQDTSGGITSYTYDNLERLVETQFPNATTQQVVYNDDGFVAQQSLRGADGQVLQQFVYRYSTSGRLVSETLHDGSVTEFTYIASGALSSEKRTDSFGVETLIEYRYDAVGNRLAKTVNGTRIESYFYDKNDRLLRIETNDATIQFAYTDDGQIAERLIDQDNVTRYLWDDAGRLTKVTVTAAGVTMTEEYLYDSFGVRTAIIRDGERIDLIYDVTRGDLTVLETIDSDSNVIESHTYSNGLVSTTKDETIYAVADSRGSIRIGTAANGVTRFSQTYDAFGEPLEELYPGLTIGMNGQTYDAFSGLYYLQARFYSARDGLFLSPDLAEGLEWLPQSHHDYAYAWNDPVNLDDPTGLSPLTEQIVGLSIQQKVILSLAVGQALVGTALRQLYGTLEWNGPTLSLGYGKLSLGLAAFLSAPYKDEVSEIFVLTFAEEILGGGNSLQGASSKALAQSRLKKYAGKSFPKGTPNRKSLERKAVKNIKQDQFNVESILGGSIGDATVNTPLLFGSSAAGFAGFYTSIGLGIEASGFGNGQSGLTPFANGSRGGSVVNYGFAYGYSFYADTSAGAGIAQKQGRGFVDIGYSYSIQVGFSVGIGSYNY